VGRFQRKQKDERPREGERELRTAQTALSKLSCVPGSEPSNLSPGVRAFLARTVPIQIQAGGVWGQLLGLGPGPSPFAVAWNLWGSEGRERSRSDGVFLLAL
jgi:hypothetical protein